MYWFADSILNLERVKGIKPSTDSLEGYDSITELHSHICSDCLNWTDDQRLTKPLLYHWAKPEKLLTCPIAIYWIGRILGLDLLTRDLSTTFLHQRNQCRWYLGFSKTGLICNSCYAQLLLRLLQYIQNGSDIGYNLGHFVFLYLTFEKDKPSTKAGSSVMYQMVLGFTWLRPPSTDGATDFLIQRWKMISAISIHYSRFWFAVLAQ